MLFFCILHNFRQLRRRSLLKKCLAAMKACGSKVCSDYSYCCCCHSLTLRRWLKNLNDYGICLITGLSTEKGAVHKVTHLDNFACAYYYNMTNNRLCRELVNILTDYSRGGSRSCKKRVLLTRAEQAKILVYNFACTCYYFRVFIVH